MDWVPAHCPHCGTDFDAPLRFIGMTVELVGNEVPCWKCGGWARVIEGEFIADDDGELTLVSGPAWSWELVERLHSRLPLIIEANPADPIAAVEQISPELGRQIEAAVRAGLAAQGKPANQRRRRQLAKKVLLGLVAVVGFSYGDAAHNVNVVAERVEHVLQYVAAYGDVPPQLR